MFIIEFMKEIDYLHLDGKTLKLFLTVLETGSVTQAAERLGITQSAVSHTLDKLRGITGDPLFVKAGRGILATARAEAMAEEARELLSNLKKFSQFTEFNIKDSDIEFVVAANDYPRDLLLTRLMQEIWDEAPRLRLRVIPAGMPSVEMLRAGRCDLVLSPEFPEGPDVLQRTLLADALVCFHDPAVRSAPASMEEYLAARHIGLRFDDSEKSDVEHRFRALGIFRHVAVTVDSLAATSSFMRGSDLLAIGPALLGKGIMRDFAMSEPPFSTPPFELKMAWHRRHDDDIAHRWLRARLVAIADKVA